MTLINVFGVWLMAVNISYLSPTRTGCDILFATTADTLQTSIVKVPQRQCSEVAAEINRQLKEHSK